MARVPAEQLNELPADPFETVVLEVLEDLHGDDLNITPRAQEIAANIAKQFLVDIFAKAQAMETRDALQPETLIAAANEMKVFGENIFKEQTSDDSESNEEGICYTF
eukprot:TRINITY_DN10863_c0_g1_i1.p1 TRINITY_DN10863_c0_g1~~TRINITY_DN10863_c0_g1_i1.p1  ORF type:complete len:107 (-),score=29.19 TRINITY_DN10863_c0_g1_i1:41-361(-)